jgi:hypothetical protein
MAAKPRVPGAKAGSPLPAGPGPLLTQDEQLSPLFRSLRDIDKIEDDELRLAAALDRLDHISNLALNRSRLSKDGGTIVDPDAHAAIKCEEVAHRLLRIEPRKVQPKTPDMSVFDKKPALVKA